MIGIYKITSPTNKIYIGQSWTIEKREKAYGAKSCKKQPKLYFSINKHGWKSHKFEAKILLSDSVTQSCLDFWEQYLMDLHRERGHELMNLKEAGSHGKHSEETKEKQSRLRKGKYIGEKHPNFGKKRSEEWCKNQSELRKGTNTGNKNPMFGKTGVLAPCFGRSGEKHPMFGKKHSDETKEKQKISHKGLFSGEKHPMFGRKGSKNSCSKPVLQFTKEGIFVKEWDSLASVQRELSIYTSSLALVCANKRNHAGGFVWKYADS